MINYFTDNQQRDAQLVLQLHATRTLSAVHEVRTDSDIRRAMVVAIADHGQLVISGKYTNAMRKLALAIHLCGLDATDVRTYLASFHSEILNAPAAAHAASPTRHVAAVGQNTIHP